MCIRDRPQTALDALNAAIRAALAAPAVRQQLEALYIEPRASTPQDASVLLRDEIRRWGGVIERAHIPKQG